MSWPNDSSSQEEEEEVNRRRKRKLNRRRKRNTRKWRNRGKQAPNRHPVVQSSSKVKRSKRPNHVDDDDRGSGGRSWTRRNVSPLMTHGWILTPQLVVAPRDIQPHRSWGHQGRWQLKCMHGSRRWRNSELAGHEGCTVLACVNL